MKYTPRYGLALSSEAADTLSGWEREGRNELGAGQSPPFTLSSQAAGK